MVNVPGPVDGIEGEEEEEEEDEGEEAESGDSASPAPDSPSSSADADTEGEGDGEGWSDCRPVASGASSESEAAGVVPFTAKAVADNTASAARPHSRGPFPRRPPRPPPPCAEPLRRRRDRAAGGLAVEDLATGSASVARRLIMVMSIKSEYGM
ncbi:hypothetical protein [Streptomyces sp. NBC_00414]|uniref:hypothetical protein n=1 Tax=Streptomyces sp. NBC_00414 TaxID=2975739 RepID=UPI003FA6D882